MQISSFLIRARVLTGFIDVVGSHPVDPQQLLLSAGIDPAMLTDPNAAFPLQAFAQLMVLTAERLQIPDFALQMAAFKGLTVLGPIALIGLNSATVEDALKRVKEAMPYHSPALQIRLERTEQWSQIYLVHDVVLNAEQKRHLAEHMFLYALNVVRSFSRQPGTDWTINFEHSPGLSEQRYKQLYNCKVKFNQPFDSLLFPTSVLDIPMQAANSEIGNISERYVRSLIRNHPLDLIQQIEELIQRQLGVSRCTLQLIAEQLNMPSYSLQRRLAALNTCFEDIIDRLRRSRAEKMLPLTALPLTRIAESLGYSSQTSFTRSCHRWFGESPQALRTRLSKE